jgi:hypothetical protein
MFRQGRRRQRILGSGVDPPERWRSQEEPDKSRRRRAGKPARRDDFIRRLCAKPRDRQPAGSGGCGGRIRIPRTAYDYRDSVCMGGVVRPRRSLRQAA